MIEGRPLSNEQSIPPEAQMSTPKPEVDTFTITVNYPNVHARFMEEAIHYGDVLVDKRTFAALRSYIVALNIALNSMTREKELEGVRDAVNALAERVSRAHDELMEKAYIGVDKRGRIHAVEQQEDNFALCDAEVIAVLPFPVSAKDVRHCRECHTVSLELELEGGT